MAIKTGNGKIRKDQTDHYGRIIGGGSGGASVDDFVDSDSIVVSEDTTTNKIKMDVTTDLITLIARSLRTPLTPPTALELVGVDETNAQTSVDIKTLFKHKQTSNLTGMTRDYILNLFESGKDGSVTGQFIASESPTGLANTTCIVKLLKRWDDSLAYMIAMNPTLPKIWVCFLNRISSPESTWSTWREVSFAPSDSGWLNTTTDGKAKHRRIGNTLWIHLNSFVGASADATTIFTLPSGYRPSEKRNVIVANGGGTKMALLVIDTNGAVKQYGGTDGGSMNIFASFSILLD